MGARTQATRRGERESEPAGWSGTRGHRLRTAGEAILGTTLLVGGLRRRSAAGFFASAAGGWLVWRAINEQLGGAEPRAGTAEVSRATTVSAPPEALYEAWRDPEVLSETMGHFATVESIGGDSHRWSVDGPAGRTLTWETEVVAAEPGDVLGWASRPDERISMQGTVRFHEAPGDRGTRVQLAIRFDPPGGPITATVLDRLELAPETLVGVALSRFKSLIETGEVPTLDGNPSARGAGDVV